MDLVAFHQLFYLILRGKIHFWNEKTNWLAVSINAEAPFGGIKQSGYGREGGSMAIKDYLNVKYTHLGLKGW